MPDDVRLKVFNELLVRLSVFGQKLFRMSIKESFTVVRVLGD